MRQLPKRQQLFIAGPAGRLEALLESPNPDGPAGCAVVCHPHPSYGGTMQNKVAHTLARAFVGAGVAALRFNFRGTGASEGDFDNGRGEVRDVIAAADWLRSEMAGLPLWISGFSFGGAMAIRSAVECHPAGLISIAPAVSRFANDLPTQPTCPWLVLQGDQDELVDIDETIGWFNGLEPGPELVVLPDTGHFFHGKLVLLRDAVADFVRKHAGRVPGPG